DVLVTVWVEQKEGQQVKRVTERRGTVDPNLHGHSNRDGSGHIMDGQYSYGLSTHKTSDHADTIDALDPDNTKATQKKGAVITRDGATLVWDKKTIAITGKAGSGKRAYTALRANRRIEIWRESMLEDGILDPDEVTDSQRRVAGRQKRWTDDKSISANVHSSPIDAASSAACINIPPDLYEGFIAEIKAAHNGQDLLFTLIDASKIDASKL
ncbi:MAG: hypothetical protein AAFX99_18125, partial [Myxococcota bacterium]